MEKAIIGKKVGMTQIFDDAGKVIPVTVIEAGPCTVVQKKTAEKDGYNAVQLGYEDVAEKKLTKPELGHLKKAGGARKKTLKEFKLNNCDALNVGDEVKVVVIEVDDRGKISLDRLDKPEAPARAEGASEGDGEHFQRRERPRRERSERSDRPRRPGDNGGRKPRRHHDAE